MLKFINLILMLYLILKILLEAVKKPKIFLISQLNYKDIMIFLRVNLSMDVMYITGLRLLTVLLVFLLLLKFVSYYRSIMNNLKYLKKFYNISLLTLTKSFCNDEISVDDFKSALHELCTNYRKDFGIRYYGKS